MTDLAQPPVTARSRITMLPLCWLAASAVAMNVIRVPDPSTYVLVAASVLALVMLRRRTS